MSEPPSASGRRLPVAVSRLSTDAAARRTPSSAGAFDAQVLGQGGVRRGLRAGPPALDEAQQTYLETEWSGPSDRRAPAGVIRREKV